APKNATGSNVSEESIGAGPENEPAKDLPGPSDGEVGMDVRVLGGRALVTRVDPEGPAARAGVQPGWIIESVAGESLKTLFASLPSDLSSERLPFISWGLVAHKLSGRPGA